MDPSDDPVRVVISEDSVLLREGLTRILAGAGFEVVASSDNADDLLVQVMSLQPEVVIVDVRLPPSHTDEGLRAAQEIRQRWPSIGVVVLSQFVEVGLAARLLAGGPHGLGYLLTDRVTDIDEFLASVRRVAGGGSALDPTVVSQLLSLVLGQDEVGRLTPREREVLALMAEGRSNQAIADMLVLSLRAVEKYVTGIFDKLGLPATREDHRRVLAVLRYLRADGRDGAVNRTPTTGQTAPEKRQPPL